MYGYKWSSTTKVTSKEQTANSHFGLLFKSVHLGKEFDAEVEQRKHFIYLFKKVVVKRPFTTTFY